MSRQPTANAGKKLGRYLIQRELGRGGMGVVYVAEDTNTGRQIALKTTSVAGLGGGQASRNQRRQRFVREVQALTQVNHDNVVHVIDAGEADDPDLGWLLFYSMEYVEGETLAQLVQRKGALDPGAAAAVCMQVAAGLGAAHHAGIVHRDVKPANIFISLDSRALIGDFGICKIEGQTQITRRDQLVGTPNYLAPEQILGDPVSPATDVFALGALYYVITMNRPLRSHVDAAALLQSAQGNEPKDRMLAERTIPDALRRVVARCLERDPKRRWPDGQQLADALADFATRIPSLREQTMNDPLRDASSTSDRSSPFASLPSAPTGDIVSVSSDDMPFADPMDVEAAARALLGEVEQRESATAQKKHDDKADKSLPVAKTESTVMFNLRAMEEENKKLPVAKTESTVVFKGRPQAPDDKRPPEALSRLDETSMGMADDDTPGADETGEEQQVQPRVRHFEVAPAAPRVPFKLPLPSLSRPTWIGVSGACGALLGIVMVFAFAKPSHSAERPVAVVDPAVKPQRPLICPESNDDVRVDPAVAGKKAKELIEQSLKMEMTGAESYKRRELLQSAIQLDPHNAQAFFELGRVLASGDPSGGRSAFSCVCIVSPLSPHCERVKSKELDK